MELCLQVALLDQLLKKKMISDAEYNRIFSYLKGKYKK